MRSRVGLFVFLAGCGGGDGGAADDGTGSDGSSSSAGSSDASTLDPASSGAASGDATTTMVTGVVDSSETAAPACSDDAECSDPNAPLCDAGTCVPCNDVASPDDRCATLDPNTPACGDAGACVECTAAVAGACDGATPVCDAGTQSCRGCIAHDECELACERETGECFPTEDDGGCVIDVPTNFVTIIGAVASIDPGERCVIRLADIAGDDYVESVSLDQGKRLAVIPQSGVVHVISPVGPAFEVSDGGQLYLESIDVVDGVQAIHVDGAGSVVHVDHAEVVRNATLEAVRATNGAHVELRNVIAAGEFVLNTGGSALRVGTGASATVLDTTLVGIAQGGFAISCDATATVDGRNLILFGSSATADTLCTNAVVTHSATDTPLDGDGNLSGMLTLESFADFAGRDLRITGATANTLAAVGLWQDGDPTDDLDGGPRAAIDGANEPPGANVP